MSDTYVEGDPPSIAATTRALAAVLVESADALGSDDLAAVIHRLCRPFERPRSI